MSRVKKSLADQLRENLAPQGSLNICHIHMYRGYFEKDFIWNCINEVERMPMRVGMGEPATNLEKLAYLLLMESAGLEP